jgi:hypothetical protein
MLTVHALRHVLYRFSSGTEQKKIFLPKRQLTKPLKEQEVLSKRKEKITLTRQTQYENMIAFGAWPVSQFVLHRQSKLINPI